MTSENNWFGEVLADFQERGPGRAGGVLVLGGGHQERSGALRTWADGNPGCTSLYQS